MDQRAKAPAQAVAWENAMTAGMPPIPLRMTRAMTKNRALAEAEDLALAVVQDAEWAGAPVSAGEAVAEGDVGWAAVDP